MIYLKCSKIQITSLINFIFFIQSCSYTYISPNIETKINSYDNEQDFVFDGKSLNKGEEFEKTKLSKYIPDLNVGNKWEYQTIYHLYNKDFTFTSAYREFTIKNLGDNPVNTSIEIDDIKRNTDYIRLKVNNLKINIENDNKFVTSLKELEIIPITRYCVNLFPVWLASGNMVGFLDPKYKSLSENYEFAFDLEVKKRRYSKYKFIQNQETIFNNKKYTGYKFSYELNDIIRMNHPLYNTDFNKEGFVNVKGESIFIKGIGIIRDESNIEAEYFYRNERYEGRSLLSSEPIRQKLKYKAISELKNVVLK